MVGAGAAMISLAMASTGCPCSIRFVSCIVFSSKTKTGRASRRRRASAALPSACAASGGSAPNPSDVLVCTDKPLV